MEWGAADFSNMAAANRQIEIRAPAGLFAEVRTHVEDFSDGEQAGFLICSLGRTVERDILIARVWLPVPADRVVRDARGFMLAWRATFNAQVLEAADALGAAPVLIHSHGASLRPRLSGPDKSNAAALFPSMSRMLPDRPCGTVVLGNTAASGLFWRDGRPVGALDRLSVVGAPIEIWLPTPSTPSELRVRLDRQTRALGARSDAALARATVAVIGLSGGGSHVCQQLAHQGVGNLVGIDDQVVEDVQLGRMVGATSADVGNAYKTEVMSRLTTSIDSEISFHEVRARFPATEARMAMLSADIVIACVDTFVAREQINAFCRRYHLPLIDVGMNIKTDARRHLLVATGQVIVVTPDSSCLRCGALLSEAVLERERLGRPPGYDLNADAPGDPQVVSMNGVLASEAANCALDLITGYASGDRGAAWWLYDGRIGSLQRCELPSRRPGCSGCAEQGHGDPISN